MLRSESESRGLKNGCQKGGRAQQADAAVYNRRKQNAGNLLTSVGEKIDCSNTFAGLKYTENIRRKSKVGMMDVGSHGWSDGRTLGR